MIDKPVQRSMVAHLWLQRGGFVYWWYDGSGTRWARGKTYKKVEQVVRAIVKAGFGRYEFEGKVIPLVKG